ncbi:hypothetical protein ACVW19_001712 [Streptomyces sp. TE5632]
MTEARTSASILGDDLLGFLQASLGGQPAGRLGHLADQEQRQQHRQAADQEHRLPAEVGDDPDGGQGGRRETGGEDQLVEQHQLAAVVGAGDLVDVGGGDGHHAADADALDEAEAGEHLDVGGAGHQDAGEAGDQHAEGDGAHPADPVAEPAGAERAEQHADRGGGDGEGRLAGGEVPLLGQDGQCGGGEQEVEPLEEGDGADQEADLDVPPRVRQPFESRGDGAQAQAFFCGHGRHGDPSARGAGARAVAATPGGVTRRSTI